MGVQIKNGGNTNGLANVNSNYELNVCLSSDETVAGFANLAVEVDPGANTGTRYVKALEASDDYRLRTGLDAPIFNTSFEGAQIPRGIVTEVLSTLTSTMSGGYYILNAASNTAAGHGIIRSYRTFPLFGTYPTYVETWARIANAGSDLSISEFGLGYPTASNTTAPTDGIFFRVVGGGGLRAVASFGGTPEKVVTISTTGLTNRDGTAFDISSCQHYLITLHNDECEFWINDVLVARIECPSSQPFLCSSSEQQWFARTQNTTTVSSARRLEIGFVNITQGDMHNNKPYSHILCGAGAGSYQIQQGTASGGTVSRGTGALGWPTSGTARIAGTWTATTAPALNSLGGLWTSPAISTLTSDADYPVFAYTNPAGSATLPGKTLYITGVRVGETVAAAAASTNPIILSYAIGVGSTSTATNNSDAATTLAARIIPVGSVSFLATAVVGTKEAAMDLNFQQSPLVCPPGTVVHFIVRPFGTVTSNTLTVTGSVTFIGYFE